MQVEEHQGRREGKDDIFDKMWTNTEGPRAHPGQSTMAKAKDRANGFSLAKQKETEEEKEREMRKRDLAKGSERKDNGKQRVLGTRQQARDKAKAKDKARVTRATVGLGERTAPRES